MKKIKRNFQVMIHKKVFMIIQMKNKMKKPNNKVKKKLKRVNLINLQKSIKEMVNYVLVLKNKNIF